MASSAKKMKQTDDASGRIERAHDLRDPAQRRALIKARSEGLKVDARDLALDEIAEAVGMAFEGFDGSLADFELLSGFDKAHISNIANGKQDVQVATLARIALALGKSLQISIK